MGEVVKKKRLVCGVGINDADYMVQSFEVDHSARYSSGEYKKKLIWVCPYYQVWVSMLKRCYSDRYTSKDIYKDCTVAREWKLFSNFRKWMVEQDWEGMQLDKDLLVVGNKLYSKGTCVFVTRQVNMFTVERGKSRGEWPIGTSWHNGIGKFKSECRNPFTGNGENLGYFACQWEAHAAWLAKKLEHAYALAAIQTDPRVAAALIERYTNYQSDRIKED